MLTCYCNALQINVHRCDLALILEALGVRSAKQRHRGSYSYSIGIGLERDGLRTTGLINL